MIPEQVQHFADALAKWDYLEEGARVQLVEDVVFRNVPPASDEIKYATELDGNVMISIFVRMTTLGFRVELEDGVQFFFERLSSVKPASGAPDLDRGEQCDWGMWEDMPDCVAMAAVSAVLKFIQDRAKEKP